jgi:hypothetical protein
MGVHERDCGATKASVILSDPSVKAMRPTTPDSNSAAGLFRDPKAAGVADAGSPDDPIMREALRLIEAFLAIEDAAARAALITLAEGLVSYDWVRKVQRQR